MKLNGIELLTQDVERLVAFYVVAFRGTREDSHGGPNRIEVLFDNGGQGANLAITRSDRVKMDGHRAICMEVMVENVDEEYRRIQNAQIDISEPLTELPWGYRYFGVFDPDGNHISFVGKL